MTLDFPDNENTAFWVGTEEGNVYQANCHDRVGAKARLDPVMGLNFHPLIGVDFSDLFCRLDREILPCEITDETVYVDRLYPRYIHLMKRTTMFTISNGIPHILRPSLRWMALGNWIFGI